MSSIYRHANPQEGLFFESKFCPKDGCGSPMIPYSHRGRDCMRCSKKKCQHITNRNVSVYFHQKGAAHTAVRCLCDTPCSRNLFACVTHSSAPTSTFPLMHTTRHPCMYTMSTMPLHIDRQVGTVQRINNMRHPFDSKPKSRCASHGGPQCIHMHGMVAVRCVVVYHIRLMTT